jgi:16S rRNA (guanine527-N7)-methyltransferase
METRRIAELLAPFLDGTSVLNTAQLAQISTYIDLLIRWNSRVNLTAIRTPEGIVTRHFGESFFAARHLFPQTAEGAPPSPAATTSDISTQDPNQAETSEASLHGGRGWSTLTAPSAPGSAHLARLVDIGSGAGFPGLPIKIWSSGANVTLIESNNKKVAFLREVIRSLALTNIDVSATRAEDFPAHSAGTVTLRAVERFSQILPTATRLLVPNGRLALLIGESQLPEAIGLTAGLSWSRPIPIPSSKASILAIAETGASSIDESGM